MTKEINKENDYKEGFLVMLPTNPLGFPEQFFELSKLNLDIFSIEK